MSLNWSWKEKIGEIDLTQERKLKSGETWKHNCTLSLYEGNAFLIMIHEYKDEEGKDRYNLYSFFANKEHGQILLGLKKNYEGKKENIFSGGLDTWKTVRLYKNKSRNFKTLVQMFAEAFDNLTIEIITEEETA